ncbi:ATP-dependent protease La Type I [Lachnospiraceae bacterium TWA4]|nr:ATP-dependent protease La Type I [Lachnospiraceae bacterium TWA4]
MNFPVIALRGLTILPGMVVHFDASRKKSIDAAQKAMMSDQKVFVTMQKDSEIEDPYAKDLCIYGTLVRVKQLIKMQGNIIRIMVEGLERCRLNGIIERDPYLVGDIEFLPRKSVSEEIEYCRQEAMVRILKEDLDKYSAEVSNNKQAIAHMMTMKKLDELLNQIGIIIPFDPESKQRMLDAPNYEDLYLIAEELLRREAAINEIKKEFQKKVKERIDKSQKEYVLREQMKVIREELGEDSSNTQDADEYEKQANALNAPDSVKEVLLKEIKRFKAIPNGSQEGTVSRNYIETLLELPWNNCTQDNNDTIHAMNVLNEDHYGLEKVKERVVEYLAVRTLVHKGDTPIICLAGPPGTGKTSIAKSVARALGKKYHRISLGGVRDEAEIRGHRRTYLGAMPGCFAKALKEVGTSNPLILLDEIDKTSSDYKGDVASALLEVLDSEQNNQFKDHYIEVPLDLSKVLFIATANDKSMIPRPLLDRMEVIDVTSYTENEKFHIAKDHLIPKQLERNGLTADQLSFTTKGLQKIIHNYTREAGVRTLERQIAKICRKVVREILEQGRGKVKITETSVEKYLGMEKITYNKANTEDQVGIVRGLAWTSVGGDTLEIEVNVMPGSGNLQLTGQMGDVMKESAQLALTYVRSVASEYGIDKKFFEENDIHLHIPEGAVPKDGPSAGITMTTAILSAVTKQKVYADLAMTGEVTLRGRVLPIGGLKEKLLAAKMADIHRVLVPDENRSDVSEISTEITKGLDIVYVKNMSEVLGQALL